MSKKNKKKRFQLYIKKYIFASQKNTQSKLLVTV